MFAIYSIHMYIHGMIIFSVIIKKPFCTQKFKKIIFNTVIADPEFYFGSFQCLAFITIYWAILSSIFTSLILDEQCVQDLSISDLENRENTSTELTARDIVDSLGRARPAPRPDLSY